MPCCMTVANYPTTLSQSIRFTGHLRAIMEIVLKEMNEIVGEKWRSI